MRAGGSAPDGGPSLASSPRSIAPTAGHRRGKAFLFVACCGWAGVAPHWLDPLRGLLPALTLALLLGGYSVRTVLVPAIRQRRTGRSPLPDAGEVIGPLADRDCPMIDIVVAARDEEAVIVRLVERIARLRYPLDRLRLWVIDDGSVDATPHLLERLQASHPMLRVLQRPRDAGGGKSGALNLVLQQLEGRWMFVLDADADLQPDLLERLIPHAEAGAWKAVQLRKAVVNAGTNLLTRAQAMEMAFDAVVQEGRLASGGVAELRGNGQLLRRDVLGSCGGFNEATVTDDLDLTFRLLLGGHSIGVLWDPPVLEEAVLTWSALWRQRQRWAEGGLQRFFDYWPGLLSNRLRLSQRFDLAGFFLIQYVLPVVALADLLGALATRTPPTMWPLSIVTLALSSLAILAGCQRRSEGPPLPAMTPLNLALGVLYLVHWFVVIPWVAIRMAVLPKRLVWAKTLHRGDESGSEPLASELSPEAGRA